MDVRPTEYPCPTCKAPIGTPCATKSGWHAPRYDVAWKQAVRVRVCDPRTLSIPCPTCKAPEGVMCTGSLGTSPVHERRRAWKRSDCPTCRQRCAVRRSDGVLIHPDGMGEEGETAYPGGEVCPGHPDARPPRVAAVASLAQGRPGDRQWLLRITCPYCGKTHTHGGGDGETPAGYYGHRVAHCGGTHVDTSAGYVLTDEDGNEPPMPAERLAALKAAGRA